MFKWLSFDRDIEKGSELYNKRMYVESKSYFRRAENNNSNNFIVNFWLMRVTIMTCDYINAKDYLTKCVNINSTLKEKLIDPWADLLNQTKASNLVDLNEKTNKLLESYQRDRTFTILDLCGVFLLYYFVQKIYSLTLYFTKINDRYWEGYIYISFIGLFFYVPITIYYYFKPRLKPNLWKEIIQTKEKNKQLFKQKGYLGVCLLFSVITSLPFGLYFINPEFVRTSAKAYAATYNSYPLINYLALLTIVPVCEELIFRGMLFKFIKKYNVLLAYFITSALFFFYHGSMKSEWNFISSLLFCWAYDKYKTLIAPIVLHLLNNLLFILYLLFNIYIILSA